jgi:hypothetical protein
MKNKHTPGPWAIENTNHGIRLTYSDGMLRSHVADLFTAALCEEHGNLEANARLIAAAPDLLSALSAIVIITPCAAGCFRFSRGGIYRRRVARFSPRRTYRTS